MLGYGWEAVGVVEAYMGDEELWLPTCNFDNLAAAGTYECLIGFSLTGRELFKSSQRPEFCYSTCHFHHLKHTTPACVYYSLPEDTDCVNASVPTRSDTFCKGYCKELFDGCINFKKYWHLEDEVCFYQNKLYHLCARALFHVYIWV